MERSTRAAAKNRDITSTYQPRQAIEIVKQCGFAKFDETVEVAVRLGVDPRHADQVVRGTVVLPAGTGKSVRVLVIAVGDKAREAEAAGADFVGAEYIAEDQGRLARLRCADRHAGSDGAGRPARPRPRSARAHAEPEGGHGHVRRRRRGARDEGRQDRVPRRQGRQRARADRQGLVRASRRSRRTSARSWIRSSAPSPPRRRASTSRTSASPARWVRASRSTPPPTGNER